MRSDFSKPSIYIFHVEEILWALECIYPEITKYLIYAVAFFYFAQ